MKFLKFTYVDYITKKPISEAPARNGPTLPIGLTPAFDIDSARSSGVPQLYGFVQDSEDNPYVPESWIKELTEEEFFNAFKTELKERARVKRKTVEKAGITVHNQFIATEIEDQNRVSNMITSLMADPEMAYIDFEYAPTKWITIPREQGQMIGVAVARHVQGCFSWCKNIHDRVESLELTTETMDTANPIIEAINTFKGIEQ